MGLGPFCTIRGSDQRAPLHETLTHDNLRTARTVPFSKSIVPYQAFSTKDGYMILAAMNDRQFESLLGALSLDELLGDARYATNAARVANR